MDLSPNMVASLHRIMTDIAKVDEVIHLNLPDAEGGESLDILWPPLPVTWADSHESVVGYLKSDDVGVWYFEPLKGDGLIPFAKETS